LSATGSSGQGKAIAQNASSSAIGRKTFLVVVIAMIAVLAVAGALFYMQYSSIQSNYGTLLAQKDALQANYSTLQNSYNVLLNDHMAIQEENARLDNIVNLRISETFLDDSFVEIEEGTSLKLEYHISYAGYLDINIVSANSLYAVVTNLDYNVVSRLPLEGLVNVLDLRVPILPGNTEIEIFNNDPGTAYMTINIDYTY